MESVDKDKSGRYVILRGTIAMQRMTLVNIYRPEMEGADFIHNIFFKFACPITELIIGGDFNVVLDPVLDRSSTKVSPLSQVAKALKYELSSYNLIDIWRFKNKTKKEYSFYSHRHNNYSRIDYFFVPKAKDYLIELCDYLPRILSDHAPLLISVHQSPELPSCKLWRFSNHLLNNPEALNFINNNIDNFMITNKNSASSGIIWEAMKAFLRGQIISYSSSKKKQYQKQSQLLEKEISTMERQHSKTKDAQLFQQLQSKKLEYNILSSKEAENALLRSRQRYYEHGDKIGKVLAWQIRKEEISKSITTLRSSDNKNIEHPKLINQEFLDFYKLLYKSQGVEEAEIQNFLSKLDIPVLCDHDREELEKEISKEEIQLAVAALAGGKTPGLDGFSMDFYKTFFFKLADPLLSMYMEAIHKKELPETLNQALITVLLKPGKDPNLCTSYRPISLLNSDYKILTKMIALRLERVLPSLIHMDQTGFIKNRSSFDNIRRLMNIIYSAKQMDSPVIALSLDAEKAFDRVEWPYLIAILHKMNFGPKCIDMIRMLYGNPSATVRTNSDLSSQFNLSRGTRQGCPLSPLLFALAVEPLAVAIRANKSISGLEIGGYVHKISLYADDVMLYLTNPKSSLPTLSQLLENFRDISGYKININKSVMMPLNLAGRKCP